MPDDQWKRSEREDSNNSSEAVGKCGYIQTYVQKLVRIARKC